MSRRTFSFIAVCLSFVLTAARFAWNTRPVFVLGDFTEIESYITTAMQRHNIPGLALAITLGDQMVYSKGYGTAGDGRIVTPDTPFYIGSQSKSFTAMAIMQLVEQGKLNLDAPVQDLPAMVPSSRSSSFTANNNSSFAATYQRTFRIRLRRKLIPGHLNRNNGS